MLKKRLLIGAIVCLILVLAATVFWRKRSTDSSLISDVGKRTSAESIADVSALDSESNLSLDPILAMAKLSLEHIHDNVLDYTATLEKQERVNGVLGEAQQIELKILTQSPRPGTSSEHPLHAYFRFVSPTRVKGREVIWVEGKNDNKLVAHEAGWMGMIRVSLNPTDALAMMGNKYPANRVGIENLLQKLIEKGLRDRTSPEVQVTLEENIPWEGLQCTRVVVVHPKAQPNLDFHRAEILFDPTRKIPLAYTAYLWPTSDNQSLPLEESYIYHDLKLNVGLTEADFDPDNADYNFP